MTETKVLEAPAHNLCAPTPPDLLQRVIKHSGNGRVSGQRVAEDSQIASVRRDRVTHPIIYVGAGTCGLGAGAAATIEAIKNYLEDRSLDAEIVEVGCIGFCAAEPLVDVQLPGKARLAFRQVTADKVPALLDSVFEGDVHESLILGQFRHPLHSVWQDVPMLDEHPFFAPQTRWVLANCGRIDPTSIDEYIVHGGYRSWVDVLSTMAPIEVCETVEKSGLRGRGGGGFPTGKKWRFAQSAPGTQKYLICNADEGDPGAFMDRAVIEGDPHRLVEGMAIAAYAIGASKAYVYIRAEYPLAIERLRVALDQAREKGFIGENILGTGLDLEIVIKMGAGAFVCGEETALIHSIEGRRGMPRPRPPFPAVKGLFGCPTIINNVETLSNIPKLIELGAEKFSSVGTETSTGTKVFALSGKIRYTGLVEVAMGTTIRKVLFDIGGGIPDGKSYKAVQIGGPSGGCIPSQHLDTSIDYESLKTVGAMMGSGGLVVMDEDTCMVDLAKFFMDFIQRESCGKCIPCREGTRRMLETLNVLCHGRKNENRLDAIDRFMSVTQLEKLAETIRGTSLCGLGQTAANPVLSTLRWFRDEYEAHLFQRTCPAGVCPELVTFRIVPELCKGCTACARKCPTEAIFGSRKNVHYIDPEKCIGCGGCLDICSMEAVVKE